MKLSARVEIERSAFCLRADVEAEGGRTTSLVGPNGAGKSTLLRALAGLEPLDGGVIRLGERVLDAPRDGVFVPPEARGVAIVFQDHRLFPHLDALDNVAFGLRARGVPRLRARRRAREWLARVGAADLAAQRPASLSGGEAQRVAIARALATEPALLLLDEPLAAIDAASTASLRRLLAEVLRARTGPSVLVTHDPIEAAVLGERVAVLEGGAVIETGSPAVLAATPRSAYVADHVGLNVFRGVASGYDLVLPGGALQLASPWDGPVTAVVHPRAVSLHPAPPAGSARNVWSGTVAALAPWSDRVRVCVTGPIPIVAEVTARASADLALAAGRPLWVSLKATEITVVPG